MGNETINNTAVLKSNLYSDYNDAHMSVRGHVTVTAASSTQV